MSVSQLLVVTGGFRRRFRSCDCLNVHDADAREHGPKPVPARYSAEARPSIVRRRFRADAAFAIPALFDLPQGDGRDHAIRIRASPGLRERIGRLTGRRPGQRPNRIMRTSATPEAIERLSPTSLRERLIGTGARLVRHDRHAVFRMAGAALSRQVSAGVVALIDGLRGPPAVTACA